MRKPLFDSVQSIERSGRHSKKPDEFYEIIEKQYTDGRIVSRCFLGQSAPHGLADLGT